MFYMVSYDIPDDKTRNKIAKIMLDFGARVQYSVFECNMDDKLLEKMTQKISKIISEKDSVRIYALCGKCDKLVKILGKGEVSKDKDVYIL